MISTYFFDSQLKRYLIQAANIFTGMQVSTGIGVCGESEMMSVPIRIGNRDKVVAALEAGNTQNKPFSIPAMALSMGTLTINPNRKGVGTVDNRVYLPAGGVYPTDLKSMKRVMPIPYIMGLELVLLASNTLQLHQILEQILILFDPVLQIQTTDVAHDWTKITTVELTGINNNENYPIGAERRVISWTLNFEMPIYISAPVDIKSEVVHRIIVRLGDLEKFTLTEFDEFGNLQPFTGDGLWATTIIDGDA